MRKYVNALKCIYFDAYVRSNIRQRPTLYKTGRVRGTREIVVRPNYVMVYRIEEDGRVGRPACAACCAAVAIRGREEPEALNV